MGAFSRNPPTSHTDASRVDEERRPKGGVVSARFFFYFFYKTSRWAEFLKQESILPLSPPAFVRLPSQLLSLSIRIEFCWMRPSLKSQIAILLIRPFVDAKDASSEVQPPSLFFLRPSHKLNHSCFSMTGANLGLLMRIELDFQPCKFEPYSSLKSRPPVLR